MTYKPIHDYKQSKDIDVKLYATLVFISFEYKHKIYMLKQTKTKSTKNWTIIGMFLLIFNALFK